MSRRIFVLRHGETEFNAVQKLQGRCNSPLTLKGVEQAQRVGARLAEMINPETCHVYSSPLGRALQTAHLVCAEIRYPTAQLISEPRLQEFSLGQWEQRSIPSLQEVHPQLRCENDWYLKAPGAEPYLAVQQRLKDWLVTCPTEGDLVVVSHGLTGIALRALLLDLSYQAAWQQEIPQDAFFVIEADQIKRIDCTESAFA